MKARFLFLTVLGASGLCSCDSLPPAPPPSVPQQTPKAQAEASAPASVSSISSETHRKILMAADLAFSRASEEKGAAQAFYDFLAVDGVCLLAGDSPIQGRDAIKVRFSATAAETMSWKPREADVSGGADLGYTWGTFESKLSAPDKATVGSTGKYTTVWKRQQDGGWKAALFITSPSSVPPQKP